MLNIDNLGYYVIKHGSKSAAYLHSLIRVIVHLRYILQLPILLSVDSESLDWTAVMHSLIFALALHICCKDTWLSYDCIIVLL